MQLTFTEILVRPPVTHLSKKNLKKTWKRRATELQNLPISPRQDGLKWAAILRISHFPKSKCLQSIICLWGNIGEQFKSMRGFGGLQGSSGQTPKNGDFGPFRSSYWFKSTAIITNLFQICPNPICFFIGRSENAISDLCFQKTKFDLAPAAIMAMPFLAKQTIFLFKSGISNGIFWLPNEKKMYLDQFGRH